MPQSSKLCCLPGYKLPRHLNPSGECMKFCGNSHKSQAQRQGEIILKTYNQQVVYNSIVKYTCGCEITMFYTEIVLITLLYLLGF